MKKRLVTTILLMATITVGGALSAHALPVGATDSAATETVATTDSASAMEKYNQRLADYRKDMAAYEADPGEWTAKIPKMPARRDVLETAARQEQTRSNGQ